MKTIIVMGLAVLSLTLASAQTVVLPDPQVAYADHKDEKNKALNERSFLKRDHIARNIVIGEPIRVCTQYPNATQDAADKWRDGLRGAGYISATTVPFEVVSTGTNFASIIGACPPHSGKPDKNDSFRTVKVKSVIILEGDHDDEPSPDADENSEDFLVNDFCANTEAYACVKDMSSHKSNAPFYSFFGRMRIMMSDAERPVLYDTYHNSADSDEQKKYRLLTRTITHELGHIFGFGDHPCPPEPGPYEDSIMVCSHSMAPSEIRALDLANYRNAYEPGAVESVDAETPVARLHADGGKFVAEFSADNVHVAQHFELSRGVPVTTDGEEIAWQGGIIISNNVLDGDREYESGALVLSNVRPGDKVGIISRSQAYIKGTVVSEGIVVPSNWMSNQHGGGNGDDHDIAPPQPDGTYVISTRIEWGFTSTCTNDGTTHTQTGGYGTQPAAIAAGRAWVSANCGSTGGSTSTRIDIRDYGYTATCTDGSGSHSHQRPRFTTRAAAAASAQAWIDANCQ